MDGVRRASDSVISGMMNVVQVASTDKDIQTINRPGWVAGGTGRAHVGEVLLLVFNSLQDSDLPGL